MVDVGRRLVTFDLRSRLAGSPRRLWGCGPGGRRHPGQQDLGPAEPTQRHEDWTDLDASLAAVSSWNASSPSHPLGVKLRIFGGVTAPGWAKAIDGAPITDNSGSIGQWWTGQDRSDWSCFAYVLAARYDSDPPVHAAAVMSCATLTGERFTMALTTPAVSTVAATGWTLALPQKCLSGIRADYSG